MALLRENQGKLHELAKYLYEKETITGEEFMNILTQKSLPDEEQKPVETSDNANID